MPDARCTRDLVCELCIESCTRAYRAAVNIRHSLRNGFTAYNELLCLQNMAECANGRLIRTARRWT
jgi:hypothetical protein